MQIGVRERQYVLVVVRRYVRDPHQADDVVQDALLLAVRYHAQFRGEAALRTWLHRIAVTTALGHLRKQRRGTARLVTAAPVPDVACAAPSPEQGAATRQLASHALRALAGVHARYREVLLLRAAEWTEHEIAEHLGISATNVKVRAHRGRAQLQAQPSAASVSRTPG